MVLTLEVVDGLKTTTVRLLALGLFEEGLLGPSCSPRQSMHLVLVTLELLAEVFLVQRVLL